MKEKEILRCIVILRKLFTELSSDFTSCSLVGSSVNQFNLNLLLKVIYALESEVDV